MVSTQHFAASSFEELADQVEAFKSEAARGIRNTNEIVVDVTTPVWDDRDDLYHIIVSGSLASR
jgi:hypothetical protein